MSSFRKRAPEIFTKSAVAERAKRPKEPRPPRTPYEPVAPRKFINNVRHTYPIDFCSANSVSIPLQDLLETISEINAPKENICLIISSSRNCDDDSEVDSAYFEWYDQVEDDKFEERLKKYQQDLKKYHTDKEEYDGKMQQYKKDMREYKKQLKAYHLEQMKEQKERLEQQIAKAEKKGKLQ